MTRNWKKTGYLIPENIEPDDNICICVPVPKDWGHINAFLGQITELSKWLTWEKDGTDNALRAARRWLEITECVIQEINCKMSGNCGCGGEDNITNERYTESGHLEVSRDGGATWENGDQYDPRFNSPVFPPLQGANGEEKRCKTANSIVRWVQDEQQRSSDILGAAGGFAGLVASVASAVASTGVGLAPAVVIAIMGFALNAVAGAGQLVFDSSFESGFWDDLLQILYCNMLDDGSFTEEGWQSVIAETAALADWPANEWTAYMIKTAGLVGLINAGRMGNIGTASCESFDCEADWCYEWENTDQSPDWFMATGQPFGNYGYLYTEGWGTSQIGGVPGTRPDGYSAAIIQLDMPSRTVTKVEVYASGGTPTLRRVGFPNVYSGFLNMTFVVDHWELTLSGTVTQMRIFFESFSLDNPVKFEKIRLSGLGTNPFGSDNCT